MLSHFSHVQCFVTLWTIAHQAPLSMGFSRQERWSGLAFPSPGDFPNPGIEPVSLVSPALAGVFFTTSATWEAQMLNKKVKYYNRLYLFLTHFFFFWRTGISNYMVFWQYLDYNPSLPSPIPVLLHQLSYQALFLRNFPPKSLNIVL